MSCSEKCTHNSRQEILAKAQDYIAETRFVILASVNGEASPGLRTLASFANDGLEVYFSTGKNTAKVEQIAANPAVTFLFQQEGQELSGFKNVTYAGRAQPVTGEGEWAKAVRLLSERLRNPGWHPEPPVRHSQVRPIFPPIPGSSNPHLPM